MATPLLQTKLYIPPLRLESVSRPHLVERLNEGLRLGRKLTLISAPAGFGKTTLLSEWVNAWSRDHRVGNRGQTSDSSPISYSLVHTSRFSWLSLDKGDDDLARFLTYLIAALQTVDDSIGQEVLSVLQSQNAIDVELILTTLLNEIASLPSGVVLVLDDYHLLESHAIDQAIGFLLKHLLPHTGPGGQYQGMHLVISTRSDPNIPLARLRGRGQVNELRVADLRFTKQETSTFVQEMVGTEIPQEQVAALHSRTEGWAVGLQMAAVSMRDVDDVPAFISSFAGDHRYVVDYLVDEVLAHCSPTTREFLLQTSLLERMSAPLCNTLTGRLDSQTILEQLEQDNLFTVALDQRREWYRYHHLFAQLLQHRLMQEHTEQIQILHAHASHWLDDHGFTQQAMTHALAIADKQLAIDLIERHATGLLFRGRAQIDDMLSWFDQLPAISPSEHPLLSVYHIRALVFSSPFRNADQAEQELIRIEQSLDEADIAPATKRVVSGHIASIRATLYQPPLRTDHDPHEVLALHKRAQDLLPLTEKEIRSDLHIGIAYEYMHLEDTLAALGAGRTAFTQAQAADNRLVARVALRNNALVAYHQGHIHRAIETLEDGMARFDRVHTGTGKYHPALEILCSALGHMFVECGEIAKADLELGKGTDWIQWFDEYESVVLWLIARTRLHLLKAKYESALQPLERFESRGRTLGALAKTLRIQIALAQLEADSPFPEAIASWMHEHRPALDTGFQGITPWAETQHLTHLTWIQAETIRGRLEPGPNHAPILQTCLKYLDRRLQAAQERGLILRCIECSVLKALVLDAMGNRDGAPIILSQALALAEPEGFRRVFLDKGWPVTQLLQELSEQDKSARFAHELYAMHQAAQHVETSPLQQALVEPLSPRELEVLQLLAQGLSNREIGERLFVALDTVKGHNRRIYGKLEVKNRTQAINKARSLGIVTAQ